MAPSANQSARYAGCVATEREVRRGGGVALFDDAEARMVSVGYRGERRGVAMGGGAGAGKGAPAGALGTPSKRNFEA